MWQAGQVFPFENMGYLSAGVCAEFKVGETYLGKDPVIVFLFGPKLGMRISWCRVSGDIMVDA